MNDGSKTTFKMAVTFHYSQSATSGSYLYVVYEIQLPDNLSRFGALAPGVHDTARMWFIGFKPVLSKLDSWRWKYFCWLSLSVKAFFLFQVQVWPILMPIYSPGVTNKMVKTRI